MKNFIITARERKRASAIGRVLFLLMLFLATANCEAFAQEKKMTRKEKEAAWRAERLRKRAAEERMEIHNDSIQYLQAVAALRSGSWALEANNVTYDNGVTNFVTESTNFVSADNGTVTVQTALNNSNIYSPNGLGGITLTGRISGEEMKVDRYGNVYYNFTVNGNEISATINVVLAAGSNQASANIDPNFSSRDLQMSGYIYPYNNAGIIMGSTGY